jgi:hypothetical protein
MMSHGVDIAIASTGLTERLGDLALDSDRHEIGAGPREREEVCLRRALAAREGGTLCSGMPSSIS